MGSRKANSYNYSLWIKNEDCTLIIILLLGVNRFVIKIRMDSEIIHMEGECYEIR